MKRSLAFTLVVVASLPPASAFADGAEQARAEILFKEGRKLMEAKQYAEACPKLADSQRIDPAAGTALLLGVCYEHVGKLATAYGTYREAQRLATIRKREDWVKSATTKADALEARIPKLEIIVPPASRLEGLSVALDGTNVGRSEWGTALPVDPGKHEIAANAPGYKSFHADVVVEEGKPARVEVPALAAQPRPPAEVQPKPLAAPPPVASSTAGSGQRTTGWIIGGIGLVGLAFGGVGGALALGAQSDAKDLCTSYPVGCPADGTGTEANDRAYTWATISTIGFIAGALGVAAGTVLILTAPSQSAVGRVQVTPSAVGATRAPGIGVTGVF